MQLAYKLCAPPLHAHWTMDAVDVMQAMRKVFQLIYQVGLVDEQASSRSLGVSAHLPLHRAHCRNAINSLLLLHIIVRALNGLFLLDSICHLPHLNYGRYVICIRTIPLKSRTACTRSKLFNTFPICRRRSTRSFFHFHLPAVIWPRCENNIMCELWMDVSTVSIGQLDVERIKHQKHAPKSDPFINELCNLKKKEQMYSVPQFAWRDSMRMTDTNANTCTIQILISATTSNMDSNIYTVRRICDCTNAAHTRTLTTRPNAPNTPSDEWCTENCFRFFFFE